MLQLLLTALLFTSSAAFAQPVCDSVSSCAEAGLRQGRPLLAEELNKKVDACKLTYPQDTESLEWCYGRVIYFAQQTLTCTTSLQRLKEIKKYDEKVLADSFKEHGEVPVPKSIQLTFQRLVRAAAPLVKKNIPAPEWNLRAYGAMTPNAHSGSNGEITISAGFWNKDLGITLPEIAAVLAHEISHTLTQDSLQVGCLAHDWVGMSDPLTLEELTTIFRDGFSLEKPRGQAWSQMSHAQEFAADQGAQKILKFAGFHPNLMAKALKKLLPYSAKGVASGSHPEIEERIKKLAP